MDSGDPSTHHETLLDLIQVTVVVLDGDGRVTYVNQPGCLALGGEAGEIVGRDWFTDFLPLAGRERQREVFRRLMLGEAEEASARFEASVLCGDGSERRMAWHNAVIRGPEGEPIGTISSGEDLTVRRRAESNLAQFKYALDQAAIVAITDRRGVIRYANDEFCRISRFSREELLGQDHRLVNSGHHPKSFFRELWSTIGNGSVWRGEILNRAKDGTPYWVDTTIVPLLDDDGRPESYLAIRTDVTERKAVETELAQQNTLAQVGQMAAVVAHEVRNPLAGIAGAVEIIGRRLPEDSSEREVMGGILQRIDDLNLKIEDLLAYSRPKPPRFQPVPIAELVRELVDVVAADPGLQDVRLEREIEEATLHADPMLLRDVLTNVVLNAGQAIDGSGRIVIRGETHGPDYRLEVVDDGPGMAEEVRSRVLEPFFSTRHSGTGLGLAIADRVASAHGGRLEITSTPGDGTTVAITLPLQRQPE